MVVKRRTSCDISFYSKFSTYLNHSSHQKKKKLPVSSLTKTMYEQAVATSDSKRWNTCPNKASLIKEHNGTSSAFACSQHLHSSNQWVATQASQVSLHAIGRPTVPIHLGSLCYRSPSPSPSIVLPNKSYSYYNNFFLRLFFPASPAFSMQGNP